eukprot:gene29916-17036_t
MRRGRRAGATVAAARGGGMGGAVGDVRSSSALASGLTSETP